ncbi:MAG: putative metalloprotease CJM1_0395 family protein [Kiloniellaceae bacterium]
MPGSSIGSIGAFGPGGRLGLVIGHRSVAKADDGKEIVALRVRTFEPLRPEQVGPGARPVGRPILRPSVADDSRVSDGPRPAGAGAPQASTAAKTPDRLTPEEKAAVDRLRQRDAQVRQEEQAHAAVAGDLAGPINYIYRTGPDGRAYAVGGSVPIRSQVLSGDPAEAARIGARLSAAAQAATNPSAADLAVARQGYRLSGAATGAGPEQAARRPGRTLDLSV